MKKFFPQLLLAAALLVSCDPSYDYEISVDNQTDHEVRIQSVDARLRNLKDSAHLPVYTIPAKSVRILEYGSPLGSPSLDDVGWRFYALFRDSLQLMFDDGRKLVCTAARDSAQGP